MQHFEVYLYYIRTRKSEIYFYIQDFFMFNSTLCSINLKVAEILHTRSYMIIHALNVLFSIKNHNCWT